MISRVTISQLGTFISGQEFVTHDRGWNRLSLYPCKFSMMVKLCVKLVVPAQGELGRRIANVMMPPPRTPDTVITIIASILFFIIIPRCLCGLEPRVLYLKTR